MQLDGNRYTCFYLVYVAMAVIVLWQAISMKKSVSLHLESRGGPPKIRPPPLSL